MAYVEHSKLRKAWRVRWRPHPGAKLASTAWLDRKSDAAAVLVQKQAAEGAQKHRSGDVPTLEAGVLRWLANSRVAEANQEKCAKALARCWVRCQVTRFDQLSPSVWKQLRIGERRLLRAFLRWADRVDIPYDRRCLHLPEAVRVRKAKAKAQLLTEAQVDQIVAAAGIWCPASAVLCHMIATYGHRPQSLAMATVGDYQGGMLSLTVKGGDRIRHRLLPETVALLDPVVADRAADEPLLPSHHGRAWRSGEEFAIWYWPHIGEKVVGHERAGCYHLKRFAITRMMDHVDAATAASITGHRDPATLLRYLRTNESKQEAALAAIARPLPIRSPTSS